MENGRRAGPEALPLNPEPKNPPSPVSNPFVFQPGNLSAAKVSGKWPQKRPKLPANECVFLRQTLSCQKFKVWPSENKCELWRRQSARILTYQWPVWQVRVGGIFYKRLEQNNKRPTTQLSNWKFLKDLNLSNLLPTQENHLRPLCLCIIHP